MGSMQDKYYYTDTPISEPQNPKSRPPTPTLNNEINRVEQMQLIQKEGLELFKKKNSDYGDAFANYGTIGVLVRLGDKISRCQNITNRSISMVNNESLRDTLIDLHNYAAMAIMLMDEDNKKQE